MKQKISTILIAVAIMFTANNLKAQTTAMQFNGTDCNGNSVDLFADLDAGNVVLLHFFMPNCTSCPPVAQKIQAMANHVNAMYPGKIKGYAFPFQNSTLCSYAQSWVSSNGLSTIYAPMVGGAAHVAHYGGFGMPTVVLLAGANHRVMFSTLNFSTSDTTLMRDSIMAFLSTTAINELPNSVASFNVFPNPASAMVSINLELKESASVLIDVTDITGKQIAIIADEKQSANVLSKKFDTALLPNGNYLVRLNVNGKATSQKLSVAH